MNELNTQIQLFTTGLFVLIFLVISLYYIKLNKIENSVFFLGLSFIFYMSYFNNFLLPIIATLFFFLFFLGVLEQYLRKKKLHQLIWAISLLFFSITAGAELVASFLNYWDPTLYKIYYVLASFQVFLLGIGVIFLLNSRNVINQNNLHILIGITGLIWTFFGMIYSKDALIFLIIMIPSFLILLYGIFYKISSYMQKDSLNKFKISPNSFSVFILIFSLLIFMAFVYYAFTSYLNINYLKSAEVEVAGKAWQVDPENLSEKRSVVRLFSPFFTVPGALFLMGGTVISYILWQIQIKQKEGKFNPRIGIFNIYLALGALIITLGGTLTNFGLNTLAISEMISAVLMYFGFIESDKISFDKIVEIFNPFRFLKKTNAS